MRLVCLGRIDGEGTDDPFIKAFWTAQRRAESRSRLFERYPFARVVFCAQAGFRHSSHLPRAESPELWKSGGNGGNGQSRFSFHMELGVLKSKFQEGPRIDHGIQMRMQERPFGHLIAGQHAQFKSELDKCTLTRISKSLVFSIICFARTSVSIGPLIAHHR
jgi:hypothetical protein